MFPDSIFAVPVSSFKHPVAVPGIDPDVDPCIRVVFNPAWLPYIVGALQQLLLQTTWIVDSPDALNAVQQQAFTLISMFANSQPGDCGNPPDISTSFVEDFMPLFRQQGCKLQAQCPDGTWDTIYDPSACIAQGGTQPGNGQPQPRPNGGTQGYCMALQANSELLIPTGVSAGDVLTLTSSGGAGSDGGTIKWYCPDGEEFYLGQCTGLKSLNGSDPLPAVAHMALLYSINGVFYDATSGPVTVPAGVSNAQVLMQVNDSAIANNLGSYNVCVDVTNNQASAWSKTLDFRTSPHGFVNDGTEPGPNGSWVAATGWKPDDETDGTDHRRYIFIRLTFAASTTVTGASMLYDLTKGTFTADDAAIDIQNAAGHNQQVASALSSGSNLNYAVGLGGATTFIARRLQSSFQAPGAGWDGDCTIKSVTLSGTGVEPAFL